MQNKSKNCDIIRDELIRGFKEFFTDKITSSFRVVEQTDYPYTMLNFRFVMYDYFTISFNYDRGRFGCYITNGDTSISLKNSQKWYDKADMNVFFKELQQQLELRIPDKFLEYNGWK